MISASEFIKAWQKAKSVQEVADTLGKDRVFCSTRASQLRRDGIKLKTFPRGKARRNSVKELNKIAREALKS